MRKEGLVTTINGVEYISTTVAAEIAVAHFWLKADFKEVENIEPVICERTLIKVGIMEGEIRGAEKSTLLAYQVKNIVGIEERRKEVSRIREDVLVMLFDALGWIGKRFKVKNELVDELLDPETSIAGMTEYTKVPGNWYELGVHAGCWVKPGEEVKVSVPSDDWLASIPEPRRSLIEKSLRDNEDAEKRHLAQRDSISSALEVK